MMARKSGTVSETADVRDLVGQVAEPFAKALGVFVRELCRGSEGGTGAGDAGPLCSPADLKLLDQLAPAFQKAMNYLIDAQESAVKAGKLKPMEFTDDSPMQAAANRLRTVAAAKRVPQKVLAKRLGVTPAAISRVFSNPDRSKLITLRKIAQALDVDLKEII